MAIFKCICHNQLRLEYTYIYKYKLNDKFHRMIKIKISFNLMLNHTQNKIKN